MYDGYEDMLNEHFKNQTVIVMYAGLYILLLNRFIKADSNYLLFLSV